MLEFSAFGMRWRFSLLFPAMLATLLLWRPDSLAIPCVLASLVHEVGHLLAMLLLGVRPQDFVLGAFGAMMRVDNGEISYKRCVLISLFGPLVNGVCAIVLQLCRCSIPALINALLAVINLLPAKGLDGGELLHCCLCWSGLEHCASGVVRITSACVLCCVAAVGFYMMFRRISNGSLLVFSVYLVALLFFADKNEKNS